MNQRPDWQHMAVHLLQGPIFDYDTDRWRRITAAEKDLRPYFSQLGLNVVLDTAEGYAYLEQFPAEQTGEMPRLVKRRQLTLQATVFGFFLRQELDRVLKEDPTVPRVRVTLRAARELVAEFFPATNNDSADRAAAVKYLGELADLGLVRKVSEPNEEPVYELTRLLRARFNPVAADDLLSRIRNHLDRRNANAPRDRNSENSTTSDNAS